MLQGARARGIQQNQRTVDESVFVLAGVLRVSMRHLHAFYAVRFRANLD